MKKQKIGFLKLVGIEEQKAELMDCENFPFISSVIKQVYLPFERTKT